MKRHDTGMHLHQVRFERIFDAPGRTGMFSFEAGGKREYGVQLFGGAVPRAGSRYAVVLAEADNWQTIVGWRNLETPDVHLRETVLQTVFQQAWLAYAGLPVLLAITLLTTSLPVALLVLALAIVAAVVHLRRVRQRARALAALLRGVPPPIPPGAGPDAGPSWWRLFVAALPGWF
jgi:hypothetical protein